MTRTEPLTTVTVLRQTTRGLSSTIVPRGSVVKVLAVREDPDGLKLLVRIGTAGRPFQIDASVTDYAARIERFLAPAQSIKVVKREERS